MATEAVSVSGPVTGENSVRTWTERTFLVTEGGESPRIKVTPEALDLIPDGEKPESAVSVTVQELRGLAAAATAAADYYEAVGEPEYNASL